MPTIIALAISIIMCLSPAVYASNADVPSAEEMLVDVFLVRPLGIVTTLTGTGFFVASLPFTLMGGNTGDVFRQLVAGPARFTFTRPVGELDY